MSIYYAAERDRPLTADERQAIEAVIARYEAADEEQWESFCVYPYDAETPAVIFSGATGIPLHTEEAAWKTLLHWAAWRAAFEDTELRWDEARGWELPEDNTEAR
jgi:hypothetical protein